MSSFLDSDLPPDTVARAQAGDASAREAIFRAFERPVRTLATRLVGRRTAAEDLAQDVFVDVLTNLERYDGRGSFAGWVRVVTVNRCLMYLRSPLHRSLRMIDSLDDDDGAGVPAAGASHDADRVDLERALDRLGDTGRTVVWLHDVEGYTHAEIGALLGGTASLSKSQLARAYLRLRELLAPADTNGATTPCMPASTSC
jgi:RNA polymerase sigma-70 factor (ECF subfamily)